MAKNLNRRRFSLFNKNNIFFLSFLFTIFFLITIFFNFRISIYENLTDALNSFSEEFNYQYTNLQVTGLNKVEQKYIVNKLKKYKKYSIFLLPLNKISDEIKENNWIKNIELRTNYKDTLFINIKEYVPLGLYKFNNKLFYFDIDGKIIQEFDIIHDTKNNLIIFSGQASNLEAKSIIDILSTLNFTKKYSINKVEYIKKRRWNILLKNNITLMLSENDPKASIRNFLKIEKNLSKTDIINIKYIDLRNIKKTLITYN